MIEFVNVTRRYRKWDFRPAIDDVTMRIDTGGFVGITGPSGSGKSTALYLIAALDRPDAGQISVDGVEITSLPESGLTAWRGRAVGLVFQSHLLLPTLTAIENVMAPMEFTGIGRNQRREKAAALLDRFEMAHHQNKLPSQLSGGEQQRVGIARALSCDPPLVLADEPTGNLDSKSGQAVVAALRQVAKSGKTVVMVTHDSEAAEACDYSIRLSDGRLAEKVAI